MPARAPAAAPARNTSRRVSPDDPTQRESYPGWTFF
jgi:hypothetical protein